MVIMSVYSLFDLVKGFFEHKFFVFSISHFIDFGSAFFIGNFFVAFGMNSMYTLWYGTKTKDGNAAAPCA